MVKFRLKVIKVSEIIIEVLSSAKSLFGIVGFSDGSENGARGAAFFAVDVVIILFLSRAAAQKTARCNLDTIFFKLILLLIYLIDSAPRR